MEQEENIFLGPPPRDVFLENTWFVGEKEKGGHPIHYEYGRWMLEYLESTYGNKVRSLLDTFSSSGEEDKALKAAFGTSHAELYEDFKLWLGQQETN